MEVYLINNLLQKEKVYDVYESFIWTERWQDVGDFQWRIQSTATNRLNLKEGARLAIKESRRVMIIETVEDKVDDSGRQMLDLKGRSMELILDDRGYTRAWELHGSGVDRYPARHFEIPGVLLRKLFNRFLEGYNHPNDAIQFMMPPTYGPLGSIPELEPNKVATLIGPEQYLSVFKRVAQTYDLGFRLIRPNELSQLYFEIYTGNYKLGTVFSMDMQTIQDVTEFRSIRGFKNVAYVVSPQGHAIVHAPGWTPNVTDLARKVLVVNVGTISEDDLEDGETIQAHLVARGHEALAANRRVTLVEGQVNENANFEYGVDYELGDVVSMRDRNNNLVLKRISEQIFVHDRSGSRSYPTLSTYPTDAI